MLLQPVLLEVLARLLVFAVDKCQVLNRIGAIGHLFDVVLFDQEHESTADDGRVILARRVPFTSVKGGSDRLQVGPPAFHDRVEGGVVSICALQGRAAHVLEGPGHQPPHLGVLVDVIVLKLRTRHEVEAGHWPEELDHSRILVLPWPIVNRAFGR
jgi:hypothetical protein